MTLGLLYIARNRAEFTRESLHALRKNTNWARVDETLLVDDGSEDATRDLITTSGLPFEETDFHSPVRICNYFVNKTHTDLICKLDNDFVVPPGWLDEAVDTMEQFSELELLGLEALGDPQVTGYQPVDHVGGLFVARRNVFFDRGFPVPRETYLGFTRWQRQNKPVRGWLCPPLKAFLLDRLPMESWRSLSRKYESRGWQRPWKRYTSLDRQLWDWWNPVCGARPSGWSWNMEVSVGS